MFLIRSEARLRRFRASMENRFGVKDFILFALVIILIVLIGLAMVQFDRQYDHIVTIKTQNDQLAGEIARIKRQLSDLSSGAVSIAVAQNPSTRPAGSAPGG